MNQLGRSQDSSSVAISPSLELVLNSADVPRPQPLVDSRVLNLCLLAMGVGACMAVVAQVLLRLIFLFTNLSFFGRFSFAASFPANNTLGVWVIAVPIVGGLIVGLMARYGSKAIRGHGIPEAMEQVLTNESRIPPRMTFLKPLSAAIAIGTGGPFGAEGPIIATGGALGSLIGQLLHTTAIERKTLLAAGAAAGMSATFGSPVSAVLLAVELLLFEYRARSIVPVAFASATAAGLRILMEGHEAVFPLANLQDPSMAALGFYVLLGMLVGLLSVAITRLLYLIEDLFNNLPIHWMWWPAIGGVAVGLIGYWSPRTLGVGYANIADALSGSLAFRAALLLAAMKLMSWCVSLASGTSGGTLAPLLTIGGCVGSAIGMGVNEMLPQIGIDVRVAALVGMAAMFAGASRALLASVVFAFEVTLQPLGLLPLLGGCAASYLVSCYLMRHSLMTEKIARKGLHATGEYEADLLSQLPVTMAASRGVLALRASQSVEEVQAWIAAGADGATHQGFPVLDESGYLIGVITRRDLVGSSVHPQSTLRDVIKRTPRFVYDDCTVRQAVDHMINHDIGRLPVVSRERPTEVLGMLTRSDVLRAYRASLEALQISRPTIEVRLPVRRIRPRKHSAACLTELERGTSDGTDAAVVAGDHLDREMKR